MPKDSFFIWFFKALYSHFTTPFAGIYYYFSALVIIISITYHWFYNTNWCSSRAHFWWKIYIFSFLIIIFICIFFHWFIYFFDINTGFKHIKI